MTPAASLYTVGDKQYIIAVNNWVNIIDIAAWTVKEKVIDFGITTTSYVYYIKNITIDEIIYSIFFDVTNNVIRAIFYNNDASKWD